MNNIILGKLSYKYFERHLKMNGRSLRGKKTNFANTEEKCMCCSFRFDSGELLTHSRNSAIV